MKIMRDLESEIEKFFKICASEKTNNEYRYYVLPISDSLEIKRFLARLSEDYEVKLFYKKGETILEIKEKKYSNNLAIILLIATIASTTLAGMFFYPEPDILGGLIFSAAIMFVLGCHEMGHYFAARKWKLRTSLPYFIPFPTLVGTLGAMIKHSGVIPSRKALFDVAVSGPISGLAAAVVVTYIGAKIPFEFHGEPTLLIVPPILFNVVLILAEFQGLFIHPVAFAGWVGFFVTSLNLFPIGQLDGGHIARAMFGKKAEILSKVFPFLILLLALYLSFKGLPSTLWIFWAILAFFIAMVPHPEPLDDVTPLDSKRYVLGIITFFLAAACFSPVPFISLK